MDYFAEIASSTGIYEAIQRVSSHADFPRELFTPSYVRLKNDSPRLWRAELVNWFHSHPVFAAAVWAELEYCGDNRERVAARAVSLLNDRSEDSNDIFGQAFEFAQPATIRQIAKGAALLFPLLRKAWVRAVLRQFAVDLAPKETLMQRLNSAMEPDTPLSASFPLDRSRQLLHDLTEAIGTQFPAPQFIQRLLLQANAENVPPTAQDLISNPALTWDLARKYQVPLPFAMVHAAELQQINSTREKTGRGQASPTGASASVPVLPDGAPIRKALRADLVGLAFSGGGIRSATFNLGVLQSLAKMNVLRYCDYLSTVSGGGYIAAWFSAWALREQETAGIASIHKEMRQRLSPSRNPDPLDEQVRPIRFLREFSNYLTPQIGFFSADTWTMAAIYFRNALLNLLVLIPMLAMVLLVPRCLFWVTEWIYGIDTPSLLVPAVTFALVLLAAKVLVANVRRFRTPPRPSDSSRHTNITGDHDSADPHWATQGTIQLYVVVPLLLASWLMGTGYWVWLHHFAKLSDGWTVSHWRHSFGWESVAQVLPHHTWTAGIAAAITVWLIFLFVFASSKRLRASGVGKWELRGSLCVATLAASAGTAAVVWAVRNVSTQPAYRFTLQNFTAVTILGTLVFLTLSVLRYRKRILSFVPSWITVGSMAAIVAMVVAGVLFFLGFLLGVLGPRLPTWSNVRPLWPRDPIAAGALSLDLVLTSFITLLARSRGFFRCWPDWKSAIGSLVLALAGAGSAGYGLCWLIGKFLDSAGSGDRGLWLAMMFGTPLVLAALSVIIIIELGLLGSKFPDEQREWWSRLRAWSLIYSTLWMLVCVLAMYPEIYYEELMRATKSSGPAALILWLLSTVAGIRAAPMAAAADKHAKESASTPPSAAPRPKSPGKLPAAVLHVVATLAPYIFILGLLAMLSLSIEGILEANWTFSEAEKWPWFTRYPNGYLGLAAIILFGIATLVSWRIGVNEFSMHHFYKNRLVRCYLGASRWRERKADWFTGFDPEDDVLLSAFDHEPPAADDLQQRTPSPRRLYGGPYPIVNAALNLVAGKDLAWQERKATSFVFTPKYCGYDIDRAVLTKQPGDWWPDAYAPTRSYVMDKAGPMLGTATAISGAAANPNMGRATSPASSFLMTVFNVRLGWWLPNTRLKDYWTKPSPTLSLIYALAELFGLTDDTTKFVNISDGGHFENLGVYELIRRGCRYIIASDAGQDGTFAFEDLGNLVRKCRTDFGVEIDIGVDRIRSRSGQGDGKAHCVVGKIYYHGVPKHSADGRIEFDSEGKPKCEEGLLVYLKPSITGDEPFDVLEYYKRVPEFPHESTADQWFGESQFESYRALGFHIARTAFQRFRERDDQPIDPRVLFQDLREYWHPPSTSIDERSTDHTLEYSRILDLIRTNDNLKFLDASLFDGISGGQIPYRDEFYVCNSLIQLMENVYADLDLEQNYDHPHVGGWMKVFKQWASQPTFHRTWEISRTTYAPRFQNFYRDRLENGSS